MFLEDGPLHTLGSRMHRDLDQSQWSSELTCRPRLHAVRLLCSPAGSGEACFYSTETVHFTVVQSGRAEGKSPPLSLKPQFVADTGGMCRISGCGFPTFFWFPHQSPAHPASSRRVARIIQMRLMFPPQGKSNGECRGQAVSLRHSRLSALGWGTGRPFDS